MRLQNYKNHIRFYPLHHFIFYPFVFLFLGISIYFGINRESKAVMWVFIALLFFALAWLSWMLRQHYALRLQDRIIRLEFQFKYYVMTQKILGEQLCDDQIFALRFASDDQLPELVERALQENLSAKAIKRAIVKWKGDYHRV